MKKLATIIALAAGIIMSNAQGTISVYNLNANYLIRTNSGLSHFSGGSTVTEGAGSSGLAGTAANGYYYALLVAPYTGSYDNSVLELSGANFANFTLGMMATNFGVAGGIRGNGGSAGAAVANWGSPTGASYDTGSQDYYFLVGWSANLGTTWAQVLAQAISGSWVANGFFGVSSLAYGYSGGGPNSLVAPNIFGTGVNANGLTSGFTLYSVVVPEPTTFALAGLGAVALLGLRRRK